MTLKIALHATEPGLLTGSCTDVPKITAVCCVLCTTNELQGILGVATSDLLEVVPAALSKLIRSFA
jgi:hypothetical protein